MAKKEEYWATADEISSQMDIPKTFLHKIVKRLERSGIVKLKRGVKGGIGLLKNPRDITLYDVIIAVEKNLPLNRCVENRNICKLLEECPVHPVWHKIRVRLIDELKEINFFQLAGAAEG